MRERAANPSIIMLCGLTQGGLLEKPWKSPVERDALRLLKTPVPFLEISWERAGAIQTCHSYKQQEKKLFQFCFSGKSCSSPVRKTRVLRRHSRIQAEHVSVLHIWILFEWTFNGGKNRAPFEFLASRKQSIVVGI